MLRKSLPTWLCSTKHPMNIFPQIWLCCTVSYEKFPLPPNWLDIVLNSLQPIPPTTILYVVLCSLWSVPLLPIWLSVTLSFLQWSLHSQFCCVLPYAYHTSLEGGAHLTQTSVICIQAQVKSEFKCWFLRPAALTLKTGAINFYYI